LEEDDGEVLSRVKQSKFWLKHTKCLLACMVHRNSKEISPLCTTQPRGQTRNEQRNNSSNRLAERRAEEIAQARDADPLNRKYKRIKLTQEALSVVSAQNKVIGDQLKMFSENKEAFISIHSPEEYNEHVTKMLKKLPNPDIISDLFDDEEPASPE
jgi:poly-D-alanine transfer protein DltD